MRFVGGFLLVFAACADPVVSLSIAPPADPMFADTSCVTSVEVYAAGKTYPANVSDYVGNTVQVDHPATYQDLIAAIRGKFDVPVPPTGLGAIEIYGWNGDPSWDDQLLPAELVFFARATYNDDEDVNVTLIPNVSCKQSSITVRPLNLVGFIAGGNQCAAGAVPDMTGMTPAFADIGTFAPLLYQNDRVRYFGGKARAVLTNGAATITGATTVGPKSCLAVGGYTGVYDAISCASTAGLCGKSGEIEVAVVPDASTVPPDPTGKFSGAVVGAVYSTARAPIAGATVTIDPAIGNIAYVNLDPATNTFTVASGTSTTASGLFVAYTNRLAEVSVSAGGHTAKVNVGSIGDDPGTEYVATSIVIMP